MPKKTKKDKIIAEYRRKLSAVSVSPERQESAQKLASPASPLTTPIFTFKQPISKKETNTVLALDPQEFSAIKKDLIITLGITAFILIGQIVIWKIIG